MKLMKAFLISIFLFSSLMINFGYETQAKVDRKFTDTAESNQIEISASTPRTTVTSTPEYPPRITQGSTSNSTLSPSVASTFTAQPASTSISISLDDKDELDTTMKSNIQVNEKSVSDNGRFVKGKIIGNIFRFDRNRIAVPLDGARIDIYFISNGNDNFRYEHSTKEIVYTDSNGYFDLPFEINSGFKYAFLRYTLENNIVKITDYRKVKYDVSSTIFDFRKVARGEENIVFKDQENDLNKTAYWLFSDVSNAYKKLGNLKKPKDQTVVEWHPKTNIEDDAFDASDGIIHLSPRGGDYDSVILHELAHRYMFELYGGKDKLKQGCFPSNHFYNDGFEPMCGWVEGWAHFMSMYFRGTSKFTYVWGETWDAEDTSTYNQKADAVEGRVAGTLWDLYDMLNDGLDQRKYNFEMIYNTVFTYDKDQYTDNDDLKADIGTQKKIRTIKDFWEKWKNLSYPNSAKYAFQQNGIYFRDFFTTLEPNTQITLNGELSGLFSVKGYDGFPTFITNTFHEKNEVIMEIFKDMRPVFNYSVSVNRANRVAIDDESRDTTYAMINNHKFDENMRYFVKLSSFDASPIYTEIQYTQNKDMNMNNTRLTPTTPGFVNGESYKSFTFIGQGKTAIIETSRFGFLYDTKIKLYEDRGWLGYKLLEINDNNGIDKYSTVKRFLEKDKKYELMVSNHYEGKPVGAKVTIKYSD